MSESTRIRLLIVESGSAVGGTERVVWELATRLPRDRFEVGVWLSPAPGVDELAAALDARGVVVERVAEVDSRWDWKGMLATWRRLRRARPEILHVHHVWPAADRYLGALADAAGVRRLVVTEHIEGHAHSAFQRALKRGELDRADAVTAVCGAVADSLTRDYGVTRAGVRVIPNGTEVPDEATGEREAREARVLRARLGASAHRPLWLCAARLERQKGHDVLLEAAADVKRRGLDFVIVLAGDGGERAALEDHAAGLGVADAVHFVGRVEEIGPLYAAADVVVLPSRWEGLPLSMLEALSRGRPVVASRVGGIPEVVEHDWTGILVPPEEPAALADALERLHRRPDIGRRLGAAGAERVASRFTWERMVDDFETVYDDVLGLASFEPEAGAGTARPADGPRRAPA